MFCFDASVLLGALCFINTFSSFNYVWIPSSDSLLPGRTLFDVCPIFPFIYIYARTIHELMLFSFYAPNFMVEGYAALFSCMAVVQASDSMTASM